MMRNFVNSARQSAFKYAICVTLKICALFFAGNAALYAQSLPETKYFETEAFQFCGEWEIQGFKGLDDSGLFAAAAGRTASAVVSVKNGGKYYVWASSMDYKENQGTRLYAISVNGETLAESLGKHGKEGLYWERAGLAEFKNGENFISIKSLTPFARSDALLITQSADFDPNIGLKDASIRRNARYSLPFCEYSIENASVWSANLIPVKDPKIFEIGNAAMKLRYVEYADSEGKPAYLREAEILQSGKFVKSPVFDGEGLYLGYSKDIKASDDSYFISWNKVSGKALVNLGGESFETPASKMNPYAAGMWMRLLPTQIEKLSDTALKINYGGQASAVVSLYKDEPLAKFEVESAARQDGYYSYAFIGFNGVKPQEVISSQLPVTFQNRRIMRESKMVGNVITSQPISMVGTLTGISALLADPNKLSPYEWSHDGSSVYGFSLSAPSGRVQPAIFCPILGGRDSFKKEGEALQASFYILSLAGDWTDALTKINTTLFKGDALREPYETSLSDAAANIAALMKDEKAGGWSAVQKARWNIEFFDGTTQASPLSEVSAAILTDDEEHYKNFALPSIEYTLSRATPHFAMSFSSKTPDAKHSRLKLTVPSASLSADYYAGLYSLLGSSTPFLKDWFAADFKGRPDGGSQHWTICLGVYLADTSRSDMLEAAKTGCDKWLKNAFAGGNDEPPYLVFVNDGLYPYWWYLIDMYELTRDKKYLDYARLGAFYSLSAMWDWPTPVEGLRKICEGGVAEGTTNPMWRGTQKYRLGYDENLPYQEKYGKEHPQEKFGEYRNRWFILNEKEVDGMKVSRIGLGIEQRWTYIMKRNYKNILMPGWAPEMLKVYQYTGDDIIMKFSRHAIIGRYANYPGYYIRDYFDVQFDPQYPYKGPDLTCLYHHHIPCVFGHTVDYLMAQIESRTNNGVKFPYVRQQGYVWFCDRIFGGAGKVFFDEKCRPVIEKGAVDTGNPKISALAARAPDGVWVLLLNDAGKALDANIKFNPAASIFKGAELDGNAAVYSADGKKLSDEKLADNKLSVKLSPLGFAAIKIPAQPAETEIKYPSIGGESHVFKNDLGEGRGDFHAFRIRGPFGKDSVFAILTTPFKKSGKAVLTLEGSKTGLRTFEKLEYPFEFSIYPLAMDEDFKVSFKFEDEKGKADVDAMTLSK